ncbi:MAG: hypothetical protein CVU39_09120 [Chloroflexi bacterium HGW-Chloroflexi-10]|nr:MAG: hypothetical protein CVU39_09120 [Chloroflexi bacterium HGW-Chloroflexi-10]
MSDNWIILIPKEPNYIPEEILRENARKRLLEIAPDSDKVKIIVTEHISFFDCGANLDRISCPKCNAELPPGWWQEKMHIDFDKDTFKLDKYLTPCCKHSCSLNELVYDWHQGFGKFAIEAMNPNIGPLKEIYILELEAILGTGLRVIYQHI